MIAALAFASAFERAINTIARREKNTRIAVTAQGNARLVKGLLARFSRFVNFLILAFGWLTPVTGPLVMEQQTKHTRGGQMGATDDASEESRERRSGKDLNARGPDRFHKGGTL